MTPTQQGVLGALAVLAGLIWSWISRGRKISDLNQQLKTQPGQIEIARTQEELDVEAKKAADTATDYNRLLAASAELAAKLGLSRPPNKPDSN